MTPTRIRALITTIILGIVAGCALAYYIYSTNMPNIPESAIVIPPVVEQIEQENSEVHNEQPVSEPGEVTDTPNSAPGSVDRVSEPYIPSEPTTPPSDPTAPGPTRTGGCFVGGWQRPTLYGCVRYHVDVGMARRVCMLCESNLGATGNGRVWLDEYSSVCAMCGKCSWGGNCRVEHGGPNPAELRSAVLV